MKNKDELDKFEKDFKEEKLYGGRFIINHNIVLGKGSFGVVYLAFDNIMENQVALKIEKVYKDKVPKILLEKKMLETLNSIDGIPKYYGHGIKQGKHFICTELLGPNLQKCFEYCNFMFSIKTIFLFAIQALTLIEALHNKGIIHRDIKPENFTIGVENTNKIYLIDFGLCKEYKNNLTNHIEYAEGKPLVGTARFVSINTHLGIEQSRRDDLESLGYVLLYFLLGFLPWQGIKATNKEKKYKKILKRKLNIVLEQVCSEYPDEFCFYFQYVKSLKFNENPDYNYLKRLFHSILEYYYPNMKEFDFEWNKERIKGANNNENMYVYPSLQITSFKSNILKETGNFQDNYIISRKNSVFSLKNSLVENKENKNISDKNQLAINNNSKTLSNEEIIINNSILEDTKSDNTLDFDEEKINYYNCEINDILKNVNDVIKVENNKFNLNNENLNAKKNSNIKDLEINEKIDKYDNLESSDDF